MVLEKASVGDLHDRLKNLEERLKVTYPLTDCVCRHSFSTLPTRGPLSSSSQLLPVISHGERAGGPALASSAI